MAVTNNGNSDSVLCAGCIGAQFVFVSGVGTDSNSRKVSAFPTDQKVREQEARRAAKEAGQEIVRVKRKKFVEDHHDDCGEDLSSIGHPDSSLHITHNTLWTSFCPSDSDCSDSDG